MREALALGGLQRLRSERYLQFVCLRTPGWLPDLRYAGKRLDRCTGRSRSLAGQNRLDRDLNTGFQLAVKCIPEIGLLLRSRATERKFSCWKAIKLLRVVVGADAGEIRLLQASIPKLFSSS